MDCIRVLPQRLAADSIDELLASLDSAPRLVEEIVFFTSYYHCATSLEKLGKTVERVAQSFPALRARGYRVGFNHLCSMGHHNENLAIVVDQSLPRLVGLDGQVCIGALCPSQPRVREYMRQSYEIMAASAPDMIWVDDDVRLEGHMPARECCACDHCLADFSREVGQTFTRESLRAAFYNPDFAVRERIRRLFIERNARIIGDLLALVEKTVHRVNPAIELGMMTGDRFWEGFAMADWARALKGTSDLPIRWRPGGGFYEDETPRLLFDKVHSIGRQVAALQGEAAIIQSEVENFPYQNLRKASQSNILEITTYLFVGCTGTAFNILGQEGNPVSESDALFGCLKSAIPFWNRLKAELPGSAVTGLWTAWHPLQAAADKIGPTLSDGIKRNMDQPHVLSELGLPICYRREESSLTVLAGRLPYALGAEALTEILQGGVLLDAEALGCLHELGLGHLTGVERGESFTFDTKETFTNHPLNREFVGWVRDCRQSFRWLNVDAVELIPTSDATDILARISSYEGADRGASVTTFTNELGGRVAVLSYFPWTLNAGLARRQQMVSLCDWLSGSRLPVIIETFARITPFVRRHPDGRLVIGLLNLSGDHYDSIDLTIRTDHPSFHRILPDGTLQPLAASDGKLSLTNFAPYSFETIVNSAPA